MTRPDGIVMSLIVGFYILGMQGSTTNAKASSDRYPGKTWSKYTTAEEAGWSTAKLQQARNYSKQIGSAAVLVVYDGAILVDWGNVDQRYLCHSIRKSFLSALYGIHIAEGNIDVNKILAEYCIDDDPPLNDKEKQAKVIDLLTSRSGVYHNAASENDAMTHDRPARSSHAPGTHWWYNNWSFNALGTIFAQQTGMEIFKEFKSQIADPLGMEDFRLEHTFYQREPDRSIHPAYKFRLSA
ncbi:serine hydrolase domain-containing protein, partial [Planctomycetota bacterium]